MRLPWKRGGNDGNRSWLDGMSGPVDMGRGSHVRANGFGGLNAMERNERERRRQAEEAASRRSEWEEYDRRKREEAKRIHDQMTASRLPEFEDVRDVTDPDRSKAKAKALSDIRDADDPKTRERGVRSHLREERDGMPFWKRLAGNLNDMIDRSAQETRTQAMPWGGDSSVAGSSDDFRVRVRAYAKKDGTQVKGYERNRPGQGGRR